MLHSGFGKGAPTGGLGAESLASTDLKGCYKKNTHFSVVFLSKKDSQVPPSGLNPPLVALSVDLRYSISVFVG